MILLPLLLLWVGCGKPAETPKTVSQLRDVAVAARDEAKSAQGPEAAELAAKKAEAAAAAELAQQADLELARAVQIWPNNPVAVYLTGERLAADGLYEKAADCLERACRDTKQQRLAERIARRAREVRDRGESAEPLLTDFGFLCDVAVGYVADAAKESEAARRLDESIATATQFGKRLLLHVPGIGGEKP